jgi:hypothetical protein
MSEPNDTWTKVSYKSSPTHEEGTQREAKHVEGSEYWLHRSPTSNRYTALLEEDNNQQQQKFHPSEHAQTSTIYVSFFFNFPLYLQSVPVH